MRFNLPIQSVRVAYPIMTKIFVHPVKSLVSNALVRTSPAYVQYYVTARCNLRCQQCNIIYANADQAELATKDAVSVVKNLAAIGTSVVLLTGGEPFLRPDLDVLVAESIRGGMHPRLQTNGIAKKQDLEKVVLAGANDISISLDSLRPKSQDKINGDFENSWLAAIETIASVSQIFPADSFAVLGCVIAPDNLDEIRDVIRFATEIGWWVSLVPAHATKAHLPRGFSTVDKRVKFSTDGIERVKSLIEEVLEMKSSGHHVYDSEAYLQDIVPFLETGQTRWRDRNGGVCDSPRSYFAVTPDGSMSVCCDYRLSEPFPVQSQEFIDLYFGERMFSQAQDIARRCSGCMYGSYPEITTSLRFGKAAADRLKIFLGGRRTPLIPHTRKSLLSLIDRISPV